MYSSEIVYPDRNFRVSAPAKTYECKKCGSEINERDRGTCSDCLIAELRGETVKEMVFRMTVERRKREEFTRNCLKGTICPA